MKRPRLPHPNSRSYALLQALVVRPGTFYQVVERAGFDIEATGMEQRLRLIFTHGIQRHVHQDGIMYEIKATSRDAMLGINPAPADAGQVAAPHFRGAASAMPVLVVRRSSKTNTSPMQQST
jgi:hypothetical protein